MSTQSVSSKMIKTLLLNFIKVVRDGIIEIPPENWQFPVLPLNQSRLNGEADRARTDDSQLGRMALYQLSYCLIKLYQ